MIDFDNLRQTIVKSVKEHLDIPVIRLNQNAEPPQYPYIGYTVTTLMKSNNGTYGLFKTSDGGKTYLKEFQQIWSFTAYSDDDLQSKTLAFKLYDYLDKIGTADLSDNGIVIQHIDNITNRDNLLTIDYEYRNGFDVTFAFMNEVEVGEEIDEFTFDYEVE